MPNPYLIIGGDGAGMSAASKIKRELENAEVIVFERGQDISYSACGMPYWIAGVIESDQELVILTPERAREKRGIDVRIGHEVIAIDPAQKVVTVKRLETGETLTHAYEKLLIATGASAVKPPIPGVDLPGVFTLRALSDGRRIFHYMEQTQPQQAVIIGGGYIGLEMVEALHDRGLAVTVVEMLPHLMPNFDAEMVEEVTAHLIEKGVKVQTGVRVNALVQQAQRLAVQLATGESLPADLVLISTGVRPNSELAKAAGLKLGKSTAIWVDATMRTSDPHIYAAGDCVEHYHIVLGENAWIPLATSANKGGRIAGDNMVSQKSFVPGFPLGPPVQRWDKTFLDSNMSGNPSTFPGIAGTAIVKVFDYTLAVTGVTERQAIESGKWGVNGEGVASTVVSTWDKAGYWPDAEKIKVKLVHAKRDGRILGGQLVGKGVVNKRIDIIATALSAQMSVATLGMLDLSYAPPYSPTYDPVQVCANVAARGE